MNGSRKGLYGKGHEIAVLLGLKAKPQLLHRLTAFYPFFNPFLYE